MNRYAYAGNDPVNFADPSGLVMVFRGGDDSGGGDYGFDPTCGGQSLDWGFGVLPGPCANYPTNPTFPGDGRGLGGGGRIKGIINGALHQSNLSKCLHQFFGPGDILTNANLPYLDGTLSAAQITSLTNTPAGQEATGTIAEPVPATGRGTAIVASENLGDLIQGERTYLHETANILAIQQFTSSGVTGDARALLGPRGGPPTADQVYNQTHAGNDPDIGRQFELCVFGADTTIVVH
jgi:hypothetical protein